eukprot:CAMPEP_0170464122 /NCGR_PEP_ID=MMETSP0123-20130129/8975_1 /TAXON_ID=182087 /ORGANISM="Favella ehrenbergii, Strain Fehren 1" /LENGTH=86 /DNA_ID=CAMNT_0010729721 /DNA_START=3525 /DNA_END=3785 /DNA_ORIENTATION=-
MLEALLPVVSEPFRMREVSLLPVSFVMTNLPLAFYVMVIKGLALVSTALIEANELDIIVDAHDTTLLDCFDVLFTDETRFVIEEAM